MEPERGLQVSKGPTGEVLAPKPHPVLGFLCDSPHVHPATATLFLFLQSGGGSVPPMKVVTPGASRLKAAQGQVGSPDKSKHGKQRAEYMRIQAQQQVRAGTVGATQARSAACRAPAQLGISCPCSRDQLSQPLPRQTSLPGLPHPPPEPSSPSSSRSRSFGSGLAHEFSTRHLPSQEFPHSDREISSPAATAGS